ncbi:MAG: Gfo/Idh/MocA family oxidoreductase [Spirochaetales bacterium]|jgi:predicted dehydrogenase|nr:Gfo/Idh/MocA family oxidoreductase [Spirochaetales bacterium]
MKTIKLAVIGCGNRGTVYAGYSLLHPDAARVCYACDTSKDRLEAFGAMFTLSPDRLYTDASEMLEALADVDLVVVSTNDDSHFAIAKEVLERKHHCLLEKPMSPQVWECVELVRLAEQNGVSLILGHVLRYTPVFSTIHQLVHTERAIGDLVAIHHSENVSIDHLVHSYVRGNFRNLSPIILAKSCHDLDILCWLTGKRCKKVSSFGHLDFFTEEHAPEGSAYRCLDCAVESTCPFSAVKRYLGSDTGWPTSMISVDTSLEARTRALRETGYGVCAFRSDNTVANHQVVNLEFEDRITVSFVLSGFNTVETREIRLMGTKGDIFANMEENYIRVRTFGSHEDRVIRPPMIHIGSHGGGDFLLMQDVVTRLQNNDMHQAKTQASLSLESHLIAFAAEHARASDTVVQLKDFARKISSQTIGK